MEEFEFSDGFDDLHTESYKQILAGNGFGLEESKAAVEVVSEIRNAELTFDGEIHPMAHKMSVKIHPTAIIDDGVTLGAGTQVWHWTHICENAVLERTARLDKMCMSAQVFK